MSGYGWEQGHQIATARSLVRLKAEPLSSVYYGVDMLYCTYISHHLVSIHTKGTYAVLKTPSDAKPNKLRFENLMSSSNKL